MSRSGGPFAVPVARFRRDHSGSLARRSLRHGYCRTCCGLCMAHTGTATMLTQYNNTKMAFFLLTNHTRITPLAREVGRMNAPSRPQPNRIQATHLTTVASTSSSRPRYPGRCRHSLPGHPLPRSAPVVSIDLPPRGRGPHCGAQLASFDASFGAPQSDE